MNLIEDAGVAKISEALQLDSCKLVTLDLCGNRIGYVGKHALALGLMQRANLAGWTNNGV
eukprot:5689921-Amphidinium_carterae.1